MSTDDIDALLECYLKLLDQYTALRAELSTLQSSIHQDIARTNFSSDRGIRYGQDHYDARMRASRIVEITLAEEERQPPVSTFTVKEAAIEPAKTGEPQDAEKPTPKNPLNMFGILVPQPLRSAQASAIIVVEQVIPQLASLSAVMQEMEITIRRSRKHHKRTLDAKPVKDHPKKANSAVVNTADDSALRAMATRDGPPPPGVLREGSAPPYVDVRFAEEWE